MAAATSARPPRRASAPAAPRLRRRAAARRVAPPLEHRILMTATLCLLAFGAVMVYCATSPGSALSAGGSGAGTFVHYVLFGSIGVAAMYALERRGLQLFNERVTALLLLGSFVLLLAVKMPGIGVELGGARRWIALGPFQFQPSELMKLALVLHVARYLANNPRRMSAGFWDAIKPIALVVLPACALIAIEPDLGTALVVASSVLVLLLAAGLPGRHLLIIIACAAVLLLVIVMQSHYQRARLTSFLHPASAASIQGPEYQGYQGQVVLGSGGLFGVGLGKSVQNILSLPEAQTDFMLAVVGEQLGVAGIFGLVFLYGMIAYAGMRTARRAGTRYAKLLATGLTSLILCQGLLNIFVVLGLAPLTGVPLPFISYAPTNLCVMLASVGLLLNVSRPAARRLKAVDPIDGVTVSRRADGEREQRRGQRDERRGARPRRSTG
jgi:cell division protein FtsW